MISSAMGVNMGVRLSFRKGARISGEMRSRTKVAAGDCPKNMFRNAAMALGKPFFCCSFAWQGGMRSRLLIGVPMTTTTFSHYDEMIDGQGQVRPAYAGYREWYDAQDPRWMVKQGKEAESFFRRTGITFNVYGEDAGQERLIPFDMIPRIVTADEWKKLSVGIEQRVRAINAFLHDLYHKREIVKAGKVPERVLPRMRLSCPRWWASRRPERSTPISSASIWCAPGPMSSWCWRTMRARPRRLLYAGEPRDDDGDVPGAVHQGAVQPVSDYPRALARSWPPAPRPRPAAIAPRWRC
jgi:hypothetical protein